MIEVMGGWVAGIQGVGGLACLQGFCTMEGERFWEKGAALGLRRTLSDGDRSFKRFLQSILCLTFELLGWILGKETQGEFLSHKFRLNFVFLHCFWGKKSGRGPTFKRLSMFGT